LWVGQSLFWYQHVRGSFWVTFSLPARIRQNSSLDLVWVAQLIVGLWRINGYQYFLQFYIITAPPPLTHTHTHSSPAHPQ
jgi:hypothetical protein